MRKRAIGSYRVHHKGLTEFTIRERDGVRVHHEKESDGVKT